MSIGPISGMSRRASVRGLRVGPWQGSRSQAQVGPSTDGRRPTQAGVIECLSHLAAGGVDFAITPALHPVDAGPFLSAGFEIHERLHLLERPMNLPAPDAPTHDIRPGRPWHRRAVLDIDYRAFEPFWRFDRRAMREARAATPSHRYRVGVNNSRPVGYAITGLSAGRGYLQRLAVDPDRSGEGWGRALLSDSLRWLERAGARTVVVNTQRHNHRALELYERTGFRLLDEGLVVLAWSRS